jgi:hypothetical protein
MFVISFLGEVHSIQPDEIKTTFCQKSCEDRWFSPVSPHNKADRYNITEISLKVTKEVTRIRKSRRTDSSMARKRTKGQTTNYKTSI